jgi:hypothetical protein
MKHLTEASLDPLVKKQKKKRTPIIDAPSTPHQSIQEEPQQISSDSTTGSSICYPSSSSTTQQSATPTTESSATLEEDKKKLKRKPFTKKKTEEFKRDGAVGESEVPGVTKKIKKVARDPSYKICRKILSVSPIEKLVPGCTFTKKLYMIRLRWLGGDDKIHKKRVTFGERAQKVLDLDGNVLGVRYPDFIDHQDEKRRISTQIRFSTDRSPLDSEFWRSHILNNKRTIEDSYTQTIEDLKAGWGYDGPL